MISRRSFLTGSAVLGAVPTIARAAAGPGLVEVGPNRQVKTLTHAARIPGARTVLVDPGTYREACEFRAPITLQAADWQPGRKPSVIIDAGNRTSDRRAPGIPLPEDKAVILCKADSVIRGFEIVGATGRDAINAAAVRNEPGRNVTIEDCDFHHNQANLLVTGGEIAVRRTALHHNTSDNQQHNLYYASFKNVVPGTLLVEDCRIYHSANGNNLKSNARTTTVRRSYIGTVPVPNGTSSGGSWMAPRPEDPAQEWLFRHPGCVSDGTTCDGKELDISFGGDLLVEDCHILKASNGSGFFIGYGFEGAHPGRPTVLVQRCKFYKERDPCYFGNRVPGAHLVIRDSSFAGSYDNQPCVLDTTDPATKRPAPGATIELIDCRGR